MFNYVIWLIWFISKETNSSETHLDLLELITFSYDEIKEMTQDFGGNRYASGWFALFIEAYWFTRGCCESLQIWLWKQAYKHDYEKIAQVFIIICVHVIKYFITFLTAFNDFIFLKELDRCFFKFGMFSAYSSINRKMKLNALLS